VAEGLGQGRAGVKLRITEKAAKVHKAKVCAAG
jgi:hypothetical protein